MYLNKTLCSSTHKLHSYVKHVLYLLEVGGRNPFQLSSEEERERRGERVRGERVRGERVRGERVRGERVKGRESEESEG